MNEQIIDMRAAASAAQSYVQSIQDLLGTPENLRLEEVELSQDGKTWKITLGFDRSGKVDLFGGLTSHREYKLFEVDALSGQVRAMKIRDV